MLRILTSLDHTNVGEMADGQNGGLGIGKWRMRCRDHLRSFGGSRTSFSQLILWRLAEFWEAFIHIGVHFVLWQQESQERLADERHQKDEVYEHPERTGGQHDDQHHLLILTFIAYIVKHTFCFESCEHCAAEFDEKCSVLSERHVPHEAHGGEEKGDQNVGEHSEAEGEWVLQEAEQEGTFEGHPKGHGRQRNAEQFEQHTQRPIERLQRDSTIDGCAVCGRRIWPVKTYEGENTVMITMVILRTFRYGMTWHKCLQMVCC